MQRISELRSTFQPSNMPPREDYSLVIAKQDVMTSAGQVAKRGQVMWGSKDVYKMKGEPYRAIYLNVQKSHIMLPDKHFSVLGDA